MSNSVNKNAKRKREIDLLSKSVLVLNEALIAVIARLRVVEDKLGIKYDDKDNNENTKTPRGADN